MVSIRKEGPIDNGHVQTPKDSRMFRKKENKNNEIPIKGNKAIEVTKDLQQAESFHSDLYNAHGVASAMIVLNEDLLSSEKASSPHTSIT